MGLFFDNEEEEREKRRAAEATEKSEWHRRQAAEARLAAEKARIDHENSIRWEQEDNKSKKGKIFKAIKQWQVPTDKANFELFVQTFNINYDYFKELDWEDNGQWVHDSVGLRDMLVEKARKVERIHLRGKVNETMELLEEVEQKIQKEKEQSKRFMKLYIGFGVLLFLIIGLMAMCEN